MCNPEYKARLEYVISNLESENRVLIQALSILRQANPGSLRRLQLQLIDPILNDHLYHQEIT